MDIGAIAFPVLTISGMGLLFGLGLGYAGKVFAVPEDERVGQIRSFLPGANCGGCGLPGCDQLAAAIAEGKAKPNACPVGGAASAVAIAELMGMEAGDTTRKAAFVKCAGREDQSLFRYTYEGMTDCNAVQMMPGGGSKACRYGCMGGGSCAAACKFGALTMEGGIAIVNRDACTACGMCAAACPRGLIELTPFDAETRVACNSADDGKTVRGLCKVGCIGCKLCERACQYGAARVEGGVARIDHAKCNQCGACVAKCPTKAIQGKVERSA